MRANPRLTLAALAALAAACGPAATPGRALVPGLDRVSGELTQVEVELPGADLAGVRGPAGFLFVGGSLEGGRLVAGAAPECALRRAPSGAFVARTRRCAGLLGAYAALEQARAFFISAGAEALPPAPVLADVSGAPAGLRYLLQVDAFTVAGGPPGARLPSALNPGAVAREVARRHLRSLFLSHPDEAEALALFLGAAAAADPGYLGSSEPGGDPRGDLDLSRPLPAGASAAAVLAGALWAWADASGDLIGAARAGLAAGRALGQRADGGGAAALLSLVADQQNGVEHDQACAVFRARLAPTGIAACP